MSRYECPSCGGGFHEVPPEKECPWCGHEMNGESCESVLSPAESPVLADVHDTQPDPEDVDLDLSSSPNGTTPCPECGDPMPMVTWTGEKPVCRKCSRSNSTTDLGGNTS